MCIFRYILIERHTERTNVQISTPHNKIDTCTNSQSKDLGQRLSRPKGSQGGEESREPIVMLTSSCWAKCSPRVCLTTQSWLHNIKAMKLLWYHTHAHNHEHTCYTIPQPLIWWFNLIYEQCVCVSVCVHVQAIWLYLPLQMWIYAFLFPCHKWRKDQKQNNLLGSKQLLNEIKNSRQIVHVMTL